VLEYSQSTGRLKDAGGNFDAFDAPF
jgi:hypothetical protein